MSNNVLIGLDFSIKKPAACIFKDETYTFCSWPHGIKEEHKGLYRHSDVQLIDRTDERPDIKNVSEKIRFDVSNAIYLADLMMDTLEPFIDDDTVVALEGLSFASSGNVVIQLGGYRFVLMDRLAERIVMNNIHTYAPITVKKTASCSKKGTSKGDMITAFLKSGKDIRLISDIMDDEEAYKKRRSVNWIDHLDDLVDAFWVLETLRADLIGPSFVHS